MRPHRLIHDINKPVLNLYFRFEFFIRKLDNSLYTSLIIRLTCILMINIHKNVIRYKKENELHYVNKYVNNVTSLQMVQISLINEKLDSQINSRNMILFDLNFGKLFNFNILILFSTQVHKKNC